ncbi:MAG: hypothetical protein ABSG20_16685 [Bradyrhizobium sp.]|jgi:hypothetical protein
MFSTKTNLESGVSSAGAGPNRTQRRRADSQFHDFRTAANLPHWRPGGNTHGKSLMIDPAKP